MGRKSNLPELGDERPRLISRGACVTWAQCPFLTVLSPEVNYTNGIGPVSGFQTWTTEKGNKVFIETAGSSETVATETGSKRGTYHGTGRIVGGTGRFAKLRGLLVGESKFDTDPKLNYNIYSIHGEYWFEK